MHLGLFHRVNPYAVSRAYVTAELHLIGILEFFKIIWSGNNQRAIIKKLKVKKLNKS